MLKKYLFALCLLLCVLSFIKAINAALIKGRAGPYKTTLMSCHRCEKPKKAYEKNPSIVLHLDTYNDTRGIHMLGGNFTVLKSFSQLKGKAKQFLWVNGKWKPNIVLHSTGCQGIFITILMTVIEAEYDYKKCTIPLGTYKLKEFDVNKVEHLWAPTMVYGKELWKVEITSPTGLVDCWEVYTVVEPL